MKPLQSTRPYFALLLAAGASLSSFAQTGPLVKGGPSERPLALSHEDSLVLSEMRDSLPRVHVGVRPFTTVIGAVLQDFPNNLRNITGELVLAQGEFENYASTLDLPEAQSCIVTRYHSTEDTTVSWQARMSNSDDYEPAARMYKELYRKLERCYVRLVDGSQIYLQGTWEPARKEAAFTTSTLRLATGDPRYKEVKVELELVYLLADWGVNINIITKKRDDEVGQ